LTAGSPRATPPHAARIVGDHSKVRLADSRSFVAFDDGLGPPAPGSVVMTAGVYKGRPASIDATKVRELKAKGLGASETAKALKIGRASVYRALGEEV
jgi:hypothetical protein